MSNIFVFLSSDKLDAATTALLTNEEVLAVNQHGADARPLFRDAGQAAWTAKGPGGHYLALFNLRDAEAPVGADLAALGLTGSVKVRDLWARRADGVAEGRLERSLPAHGAGLYRLG